MGRRGRKPEGRVNIQWSPDFAYAIGLMVSDGNLSPDGRHINFTSKDEELVELFQSTLGIKIHVGKKANGFSGKKEYFVTQFSDVLFYRFLESIGLMANKSKLLGSIQIPERLLFDFLRGSFDGDGSTYSYFDPRWRSSFMFYTTFVSASEKHILWIQSEIYKRLKIYGHITGGKRKGTIFQLKYAKADSLKLLRKMYHPHGVACLSRKRLKIEEMLRIVGERL